MSSSIRLHITFRKFILLDCAVSGVHLGCSYQNIYVAKRAEKSFWGKHLPERQACKFQLDDVMFSTVFTDARDSLLLHYLAPSNYFCSFYGAFNQLSRPPWLSVQPRCR